MTKPLLFLLLFLPFASFSTGNPVISADGSLRIVLADDEPEAVRRAVGHLQRDFGRVMGFTPVIAGKPGRSGVDIVVVNESTEGKGLRKLTGAEAHSIYVDPQKDRIYLHGSDMRGAIYAIYSFSEQFLGVPPLWFFSSWVPQRKESLEIGRSYVYHRPAPQVRYRAWFPNDRDLYDPWTRLDPQNEERTFETMLRLKLNTLEAESSTVDYPFLMTDYAHRVSRAGLVLTSTHHTPLNNNPREGWEKYWKTIRGVDPPGLLIANQQALIDYWRYSIETVHRSGIENLWLIAFRGNSDIPFWDTYKDAPASERERAEVINRMLALQLGLIREVTGEKEPYVRMTFYDELSDLLAKGLLKPPVGENVIWTYVAARRDHYPGDDLVGFDPATGVKLGYYMNLQFTSTGSHLAQCESPQKMEFNYRYADSRSPLCFSVVNAGNIREYVMELSANARMLWDFDDYDSDAFIRDFCSQYFGQAHAAEIAGLYKRYYDSYWQQKKPTFPGLERQFLFQDQRYARTFDQISASFFTFDPSPLKDNRFERQPGRTFRIENQANQVDALLDGMQRAAAGFGSVAEECDRVINQLPVENRIFLNDNLRSQCYFMHYLSLSLHDYITAYKGQGDKAFCLQKVDSALDNFSRARAHLYESQHGAFARWYDGDSMSGGRFRMDKIEREMKHVRERIGQ